MTSPYNLHIQKLERKLDEVKNEDHYYIYDIPLIDVASLGISVNNKKMALDFPLERLSLADSKKLKNGGVQISMHFKMLRNRLVSDGYFNIKVCNNIVATAMFEQEIFAIEGDSKVLAINTVSHLLIGDVCKIASSKGLYVLCDIDINDELYVLVDISKRDSLSLRLVKSEGRYIIPIKNREILAKQ